ncbi:cation transporter [bacterium]|nr:cation transporter [bacterium]
MTQKHSHCHNNHISDDNSTRTLIVIVITILTMIVEIIYGFFTNSMALLSDGWHMGTHALALLLTFLAYILTKKFENSVLFPNGTKKIPILAGFISSLFLGITGFFVITESIQRFITPLKITFNTAIIVAFVGFLVNGICLLIMENKHKNDDYNFKAAYLHILTDAMTSIFAIIALLAGKYFGLYFLDTVMGIIGGFLILKWSSGLVKDTTAVLIDMKTDICK